MRRHVLALISLGGLLLPSASLAAPRYQVERVVMLIRHGVRAPLDGEAAAAKYASEPFPAWNTPASALTPHGAEALRLLAGSERRRLIGQGLLPHLGCPSQGTIRVWTNSKSRTINSGRALADGLAPKCPIAVEHKPEGQPDPLFDAIEANAVQFDAKDAAASINRELDDGRALMRGADKGFATMARVLGCDHASTPCKFGTMANRIEVSPDGKGIRLSGAVDLTSGTAQVFLLQYAEHFPANRVGWGRATSADIAAMSPLHARLFDVFARSRYMAPRVGGLIAQRIMTTLDANDAGKIQLFVGHDNTIAAVTALLGVHFHLPGYGYDDPPIGGGLIFERVLDRRTGQRRIRLAYLAQTPDQIRALEALPRQTLQFLPIPNCEISCDIKYIRTQMRLDRRLITK
jgi:4-phytase/acid phosphatase